MKRLRTAGFSLIEILVGVAFLLVVAGAGYIIVNRHVDKPGISPVTTSEPQPPAIETADDLTAAEQVVDNADLDNGKTELDQLDAQLSDW